MCKSFALADDAGGGLEEAERGLQRSCWSKSEGFMQQPAVDWIGSVQANCPSHSPSSSNVKSNRFRQAAW